MGERKSHPTTAPVYTKKIASEKRKQAKRKFLKDRFGNVPPIEKVRKKGGRDGPSPLFPDAKPRIGSTIYIGKS